MFSIKAYDHAVPGRVGANESIESTVARVGVIDNKDGNTGSQILGFIGGAIGGAAGGYIVRKYVFKDSLLFSTVFGVGWGGFVAMNIGGDVVFGFLPSIFAAYGVSKYMQAQGG